MHRVIPARALCKFSSSQSVVRVWWIMRLLFFLLQASSAFCGDRPHWTRFLIRRGGASPQSQSPQVYSFPDGSQYRGDTLNGRICGQGEWRSARGEHYQGSFKDDQFHGFGRYEDVEGSVFVGAFQNGMMHGVGTYVYHDGRADVCEYKSGSDVGEGVRFAPDRTQAWRLKDGEVVGEISMDEAARVASSLGLVTPPALFELSDEGKARLEKTFAKETTNDPKFHSLLPLPSAFDGVEGAPLVAISTEPVVDERGCAAIIAEAEARAARLGGWTSSRHANYPTTDVPLQRLPLATDYFRERLLPDIAFPLLFAAFRPFLPMMTPQDSFRVVDCFVVKYNASSGQKELKPHRDGSIFSFNVALNDLDEYSDGGTSFRALAMTKGSAETSEYGGESLRLPKGHILAHSSALMHSGHPISAGVRYILVAFINVAPSHKAWARRYYDHVRKVDETSHDAAAIATEHSTSDNFDF
jgi:hypothetical protein